MSMAAASVLGYRDCRLICVRIVINKRTEFSFHQMGSILSVAWWCNGYGVGLAFDRARVRFPAVPLPSTDSGQVVHTHVPLSPSSTIWYRKGGDALRPGR